MNDPDGDMKKLIELTVQEIDTQQLLRAVSHPHAGGQVLFVGTTRQFTRSVDAEVQDVHTDHLIYQAYEAMAIAQLHKLADQAFQRWPLIAVAIVHRLGQVLPEQASIAIAVSSAHRAPAFQAASWLIDNVKRDVPIWKQEIYRDAGSQWIHPAPQSHANPA